MPAKVLSLRIFERVSPGALASVWTDFEPNKLHCLVVSCERATEDPTSWGIGDMVRDALSGEPGSRIWTAFCAAHDGDRLISGKTRKFDAEFTPSSLASASFSVLEAFASDQALVRAVRRILRR